MIECFLLLNADFSQVLESSEKTVMLWILGGANTLLISILLIGITNFNSNFKKLVETVEKIVVANAKTEERIHTLFNSNVNIKGEIEKMDKRVNIIRESQLKCRACND